jgi:hypothetical protein
MEQPELVLGAGRQDGPRTLGACALSSACLLYAEPGARARSAKYAAASSTAVRSTAPAAAPPTATATMLGRDRPPAPAGGGAAGALAAITAATAAAEPLSGTQIAALPSLSTSSDPTVRPVA